jgi:histidine triad (HIT) family protein
MDCVFCKIVASELSANKEYEDDFVLAFNDIQPAAPIHVLIVPKKHISNLDSSDIAENILGRLQKVASNLVTKLAIQSGYKLVLNGGKFQQVKHLHYHLLGGRDDL